MICPRHLPTAALRARSNYILVIACKRERERAGDRPQAATWMPWCLWNRVHLRAGTWAVFPRGGLEHDAPLRKQFQHQASSGLSGTQGDPISQDPEFTVPTAPRALRSILGPSLCKGHAGAGPAKGNKACERCRKHVLCGTAEGAGFV